MPRKSGRNSTAKTKRLRRLDRLHVWHPFTQMREWGAADPLIIERGEGNYLIDTEGRRYLDGVSSLWVNVHGHRKKEIDGAVRKQLDKIAHSTLLGLSNVPSIELAERLVKITPGGLTKVFFSDDGSTAVEAALKMAFQYWSQGSMATSHLRKGGNATSRYAARKATKTKFVAFTNAYHGDTFGSMGVGGIDIFFEKYKPLIFKSFRTPYPNCYRCPVKKVHPDCKNACLNVLEKILKHHHREIAACIIEPVVQGAAGMIVSPPGFLKDVLRLTRKYNVLFIADEVATGFGRTGTMFACDGEGVVPDILCLSKGITGGYLPVGATITTDKIYKAFLGRYDEFKTFFHGHTYSGNPLGCAAAVASIDLFKKEKILQRLKPKIALLGEELKRFTGLKHVGDVRQKGLMAGIELVKDRKTKEPYPSKKRMGHRVAMDVREKGLIIRPLGDTIVIMPPLSIKKAELKRITSIVYDSIERLTG
jgi:adenosylmethionine-8-amino-7-oxononanoate aminotransferase